MKKKVAKRAEKPVYLEKDLKHFVGSLTENYNENLKGIREGFVVINNKLDSHTRKLDSHTRKLDSHTEMIGALMEDTTSIKGNLKKKVDYDDFLSLVRR